jgi:hypothetical protein
MSYTTIDKFRAHVKTVGLPLSSKFNVVIPDRNKNSARLVNMLCEATVLPGVSIMSSELRTVGEVTDVPYMIAYTPINFTFIEDNNYAVRRFFEGWLNEVYNRETRTVGYYNSYSSIIDVILSDKAGNARYAIRLYEAFPKTIADSPYNFSNNQVVRTDVQIVYKYWKRLEVNARGEPIEMARESTRRGRLPGTSMAGFQNGRLLETLGNTSGISSAGTTGAYQFGSDIGQQLSIWGPDMGAGMRRAGNGANAILTSSAMTGGPSLGGLFGGLGGNMSTFGSTIGDLGKNLGGIVSVVGSVSTAIGGVAGTIGSIDQVFSSLGVNTGLGKIAGRLNQSAGAIGVLSQLKGLPGSLGSVGANMGAVGSEIQSAVTQIKGLPGVTTQIGSTLSNMGNLFGLKGSELSQGASAIQSGIDNGTLS